MRAPIVAASLAIASLLVALPGLAETFRYVSRDGRRHAVASQSSRLPESDVASTSKGDAAPHPAAPRKTSERGSVPGAPYAALIAEAAALHALPPALVRAVMQVESAYRPDAVSSAGARGLMQLMPATGAELGVVDAFDPRQNVMGGARLLRLLVNAFDGDVALALAGYHAGAGSVRRAHGLPPFAVTRRYVAEVLATYHRLGGPTPSRARAVSPVTAVAASVVGVVP